LGIERRVFEWLVEGKRRFFSTQRFAEGALQVVLGEGVYWGFKEGNNFKIYMIISVSPSSPHNSQQRTLIRK